VKISAHRKSTAAIFPMCNFFVRLLLVADVTVLYARLFYVRGFFSNCAGAALSPVGV